MTKPKEDSELPLFLKKFANGFPEDWKMFNDKVILMELIGGHSVCETAAA